MNNQQNENTLICCTNCRNFEYDPPCMDNPYPEIYCSKMHWAGISNSEEALALNIPFSCIDFKTKQLKQ